MISFDGEKKIFKLDTKNSSYVMAVRAGALYHLHYGGKTSEILRDLTLSVPMRGKAFSARDPDLGGDCSTDNMPMEYSTYGAPDLRTPALHVGFADGTTAVRLRYRSYTVAPGKPRLAGLPATYAEEGDNVETLSLLLADEAAGLEVTLNYSVWYDFDAIARSVVVRNTGDENISLNSVYSAAFDMVDASDYEMLDLCGAWGRERVPERLPLRHGMQFIDSKRGASGHSLNPFIAVLSKGCNEESGEAYGLSLVYSGNFSGGVELDSYNTARVMLGINPFDFSYILKPGESFTTPEAVCVYSDAGIGKMSRSYHALYRSRLCRGKWRDCERPVLINNWEATYFDFNEDKILEIAGRAEKIGVELMVVDDGWFGKRNNDRCSLGDWHVNGEKFPFGISRLAESLRGMGMKLGIWIEPEMVSPDSDLYRAHPDWCLRVPRYESSLCRHQLVLDLSRDDVCDYIVKSVCDLLDSADISYIKWDMNRNMSEIGSSFLPAERQHEVSYRYILGLYRILETITSRYPNLLIESCSGGGGRFDPGMLYYSPQIWTSDLTDAAERMKIQYGTGIVYPFSSFGSHVSKSPNQQIGRVSSFDMRCNVACMGQFGFELDLEKLDDTELESAAKWVAFYKKYGKVIHGGDCYRIRSPFEDDISVMEFLSTDGDIAIVFLTCFRAVPNAPFKKIRLRGLKANAVYREVSGSFAASGGELCEVGIPFVNEKEYYSDVLVLERVR